MATSLLDVGDPFAPAAPVPAASRRRPVAVVVLGAAGLLQAVALVAVALTGLTGMLSAEHRVPDAVIAAVLLALAGWTVLSAAAGAAVLDGTGQRLLVVLGAAEVLVVAGLLVVTATTSVLDRATGDVPVPALALLLLAVPLGRMLLAGAPSTTAWVQAGPPVREHRGDPVAAHRPLCVATLALIGLALGGLALLGPTGSGDGAPATSTVSSH